MSISLRLSQDQPPPHSTPPQNPTNTATTLLHFNLPINKFNLQICWR
ncbi:unnamed protein product, partial [Vitis vinifera]|uniref:Uncharacterized protein n=1 Tax=Vitis vinifera TaxID=29760 RepID=E0CTW2_VITVI